jgi:hypothetical protein
MGWISRLVNVFRKDGLRGEIDEEFEFHLAARAQDNVASGMKPEEAREDARRRFGNPTLALENGHEANILAPLAALRPGSFQAMCRQMVTIRTGLSGSQGRASRAVMTCSPRGAVTCRYPAAAPPRRTDGSSGRSGESSTRLTPAGSSRRQAYPVAGPPAMGSVMTSPGFPSMSRYSVRF